MSVFLVVLALITVVVVILVILALQFSTRIARTASVASVITIAVTAAWMAWTAATTILGNTMTVTVPVTPLVPGVDPGVTLEPPEATIVSGGLDRATVEVSGLSLPTRLTLLLSVLVAGATLVGVSLMIRRLARSLDDGDPFTVSGRALMVTALIVLIGGLFASVIGDLGAWRASAEIFTSDGWSGPALNGNETLADMGWPDPSEFSINIPFWPLGAGLVLALLAGVFRHGQKLRKDAEGLV